LLLATDLLLSYYSLTCYPLRTVYLGRGVDPLGTYLLTTYLHDRLPEAVVAPSEGLIWCPTAKAGTTSILALLNRKVRLRA